MIDRIREIISSRQLTPTQFADTIGVARPTISHILSGRNKPSLEVVQKIVAAFPDLSLPWLLSGTGSMLAMAASAAAPAPSVRRGVAKAPETASPASSAPEPLASSEKPPTVPATAASEAARTQPSSIVSVTTGAILPASSRAPESVAAGSGLAGNGQLAATELLVTANPSVSGNEAYNSNLTQSASSAAVPAPPVLPAPGPAAVESAYPFAEPGKSIRRIVIFYQDGTFTDYQPERG